MSRTIEAIVYPEANRVELRQFTLAQPGPADLVVKTLYTMVSTGTELRVLAGHYGAADQYPLIPGYSVVGEVIEVGADARGFRVGDLVTAGNPSAVPGVQSRWGGQASFHLYSSVSGNRPVLLPEGARPLDYTVAEIGAIAWRGVESVAAQPGETAIVVGQGMIGALVAAWLNSLGCRVLVVDRAPGRLQRAGQWAAAAINAGDENAIERLEALCPGGPEIVVEASGTNPGLELAFRLVRAQPHLKSGPWPRLLLQARYIENISIQPQSFFDGDGLTILTPLDRRIDDRQKVVERIRTGKIQPSAFIDRIVSYREAPQAYAALRDDPDHNFSLIYDWTR